MYDIENSATKAWVWTCYQTDVIKIIEPWFLLSFAWKWLGEDKAHVRCLRDYKGYWKDHKNDKALVQDLWRLMDEADVLVYHNGDRHDKPKAMSRFAYYSFGPPNPAKTVDTYKILKRELKIEKNSLDHAADYFGVGHKLPNTGFNLWETCTEGPDKFSRREVNDAWDMMSKYNLHDVDPLLEGVYIALRPYSKSPPNLDHFTRLGGCPVCQSTNVVRKGFSYASTGKRQRMKCESCGHRFVSGNLIKDVALRCTLQNFHLT
jgi:hypothetical protein